MRNAAEAASPPTSTVCQALRQGWLVVNRPLMEPKTRRVRSVTATDQASATGTSDTSAYGERGVTVERMVEVGVEFFVAHGSFPEEGAGAGVARSRRANSAVNPGPNAIAKQRSASFVASRSRRMKRIVALDMLPWSASTA